MTNNSLTDLMSKRNGRMNSSPRNVKSYLYCEFPLLDKKCDYAVIVEIEDDGKTARVDAITGDGDEIASLISYITNGKKHVEQTRINPGYDIELVDELREYLPEEFKQWQKSVEEISSTF